MRASYDLSPLHRFAVGFDRMQNLLDSASQWDGQDQGYPPYNIESHGDNKYRITMAVAGFKPDQLNVTVKENALFVTGGQVESENDVTYLHRGIAGRAFERRFQLAEFIEVESAEVEDGLLHINLIRNIPEEKQPREIVIAARDHSKAAIEQKAA